MEGMGSPATIRVVLVDDHPVVRRGLRALLESLEDVEVVGEAADGASAVREVQLTEPDVVLMDVQMPGMDGIEATRRIRVACPDVPVLILTMYDDDATVFTAMQAGARGYLLKGAEQEEIARALRAVVAGEAIFGPGVAARVLGFFGDASSSTPEPAFPELTERERQILDRLAAGQRTGAIAEGLHLSPKTVSNHLTTIFAKLQVASRAEAIIVARERGLGGPPVTAALLVSVLVPVASALGSGALMWRARVACTAAVLLAVAGGVGLIGIGLVQRGSPEVAGMAAVMALMVLLPAALWAYPRPRWRHPVDFALGVCVVAPGVVAVLRPTDEVLFLMSIVTTMALVAQGWWRLETEVPPWRGALVWSDLACAGVVVFAWTVLFIADQSSWVFPAVLVSFATIPLCMTIGVLRPQVVDARGLVVQVAVFVVLAMGYVAAFVGLLACIEILGVTDLPPAVPALVGFGLALALPTARRRLRGAMDQVLFGDRPDPFDAASNVVAGIGTDPRHALDAIREGLALPYLAITRAGEAVLESGGPVVHHRDLVLDGAGGGDATLVVGLRSGDLRLADGDARALALVAPLVVQLIRSEELTESLQASRREAVETIADERRRLRRDLHDGLGPTLTGIAFATDAARNTLRDDPQAASELLAAVRADTADAIAQIRTLVYGMRPPALDELGLVPALRQEVRALRGRDGTVVPVEFEVVGELTALPAAVEVAAYRIVVEALTNVVRHTSAGSATVRLTAVDRGELVIEVRDDAPAGGAWTSGVGIASMRERAAELGGSLSCGPTPGGGYVHAALPL